MTFRFLSLALAAALTFAQPIAAETAEQPYDLLFKNGTLDEINRSSALVYQRAVTNQLKPEAADRDSGEIALSFKPDDQTLAQIRLRQGDKTRGLGVFPAGVGNPMIMFFYESVVRDMGEATGGSPFYIRNRVKDALVQPAEIEIGEAEYGGDMVETRTVRLYPFRDDPNVSRMQGFGDLELRVTMSDAIPGWYLELVAETDGGDAPVYRSEVDFKQLEGKE